MCGFLWFWMSLLGWVGRCVRSKCFLPVRSIQMALKWKWKWVKLIYFAHFFGKKYKRVKYQIIGKKKCWKKIYQYQKIRNIRKLGSFFNLFRALSYNIHEDVCVCGEVLNWKIIKVLTWTPWRMCGFLHNWCNLKWLIESCEVYLLVLIQQS